MQNRFANNQQLNDLVKNSYLEDCLTCGGQAELLEHGRNYIVRCSKCNQGTFVARSPGQAITDWNWSQRKSEWAKPAILS